MIYLLANFNAGTMIDEAIGEALIKVRRGCCGIQFQFNGVTVQVNAMSDPDRVKASYDRDLDRKCKLAMVRKDRQQ